MKKEEEHCECCVVRGKRIKRDIDYRIYEAMKVIRMNPDDFNELYELLMKYYPNAVARWEGTTEVEYDKLK
uniref:Uncharacterized protein n=1 Tax=viral metagenome TaxID=1070528 RepID=A0A6H1ZSA7_9ZZZZ